MSNCHRNDVAAMVSGNSRLWAAFSAAALRRLITDAISCGGNSYRHNKHAAPAPSPSPSKITESAPREKEQKSAKLSDLLNLAESVEKEGEMKKKLEELKLAARELQAEDPAARIAGATAVRLLAKEDSEARATLAMLGAIPPLVRMLDSESEDHNSQTASLYALLNLGIANDTNKTAIVKAGAVHKMLMLIESPNAINPSVSEAIVANFLGLSALDSNKSIIGSSGAIPFLVRSLKDGSPQEKQDALRALYNLSILPANIAFILETDMIPFLMSSLGDMGVSERILSILSNVVSTPEGRKAISAVRDAFVILVDVLNWTDSPGCQEKVSYILMVMSHKAYGDRQAMLEAGIVSYLLELSLVGSTLTQKRASRMLECLRIDKGKQVSEHYGGNMGTPVSAPIYGSSSSSTNPNPSGGSKDNLFEYEGMMSDEKRAVKQLVQQSLQNNMRRIVKRANLPQDFVPSEHIKSLTASSTSKSLPF